MKTITINGQEYPCEMTMGALVRFKKETGYDVAKAADTADMITLLWCCIVSACAAQHKEFPLSLMEFADSCSLDALGQFNDSISKQDDSKKNE